MSEFAGYRTSNATILAIVALLCTWAPTGAQEVVQIGTLMGPDEYTFSRIRDVDVDRQGRIYVVDQGKVSWFFPDGRYGGRASRRGQGPGELTAPVAMDLDGRGRLHVVDAGNAKISAFQMTQEGLAHLGDRRLHTSATDICVTGERTFLATPQNLVGTGNVLAEIGGDGTLIRVFGEPFEADPSLARQFRGDPQVLLNGGKLLCDEQRDLLIFMNRFMGEVRAYTLAGEPRWTLDLPDFFETQFTSIPVPGAVCCVFRSHPESGTTMTVVGGSFRGEDVLISIYEYGQDGAVQEYETRVVRARDGAYVGVEDFGMAVSAVQGGRIIGFTKLPYPHVLSTGRWR